MRAAGVPLHTVSELLGHSSVAVTGDVRSQTRGEDASVNVAHMGRVDGRRNTTVDVFAVPGWATTASSASAADTYAPGMAAADCGQMAIEVNANPRPDRHRL